MKKIISLVCVALLLCTMTVSALANNSISSVIQPEPLTQEEIDLLQNIAAKKTAQMVNYGKKAVSMENIENILVTYSKIDESSDSVTFTEKSAVVSKVSNVIPKENEEGLLYSALVGANPSDFVLLVMAAMPDADGNYRYAFIQLNTENVNTEEGKFTGTLPFDGYVLLIKK